MRIVETATETLHRLTSYSWQWYAPSRDDPDRIWTAPVEDPRVLSDLRVNDLDRLPWFYKRYPESLPTLLLPPDLPTSSAPAVRGRRAHRSTALRQLLVPRCRLSRRSISP
jgi:hypothetical protein